MAKKKIIVFILLITVLILLPNMISKYQLQLVTMGGINTLLVLGLNFILGYTGEISFAQAGFWALGAYVSALLTVNLHMPFLIGFFAALVFCAIIALIFGYPTLRLKSHYFVLATLSNP